MQPVESGIEIFPPYLLIATMTSTSCPPRESEFPAAFLDGGDRLRLADFPVRAVRVDPADRPRRWWWLSWSLRFTQWIWYREATIDRPFERVSAAKI